MGKHIWSLISSLCLISAQASVMSEPAPATSEAPQSVSSTPEAIPLGMKEIVLYLTPDQVESLKDAGARVRPYPGYEAEFAQQEEYHKQYKNKYDPQIRPNHQAYSSIHEQKHDSELQEFYKAVNIHQINDDLSQGQQTLEPRKPETLYANTQPSRQVPLYENTEPSRPELLYANIEPKKSYANTITERPYATTARFKYNKLRPQFKEYFKPYLPKKPNKVLSSMEFVRWLPNWESDNLKMEPYYAQPITPYHWDWEHKENLRTLPNLNILEAEKNLEVREPQQFQGITEVAPPNLAPQLPEVSKEIETLHPPYKVQEENQEQVIRHEPSTDLPPVISDQDKYQSLLAPLVSHNNVVESIVKEKEELRNNEQEIQSKLREIKESPIHDEVNYAIEVDKLQWNLERQNALSEIIAKSSNSEQDNIELKTRRPPLPIVRHVGIQMATATVVPIPPIEVKLPRPPIVKIDKLEVQERPVPVEIQKHVPVEFTRNVYVNIDKPYLVQKVVPVEVKHEIPVKVPIFKPEKLTIIRHIWEH